MLIDHISVVIIAKNAEEIIEECLSSLKDFSEVLLYLNGSTDQTQKIAGRFPNVKVVEGDFIGFGPTKNRAAEYAGSDWILSLDSDEILSKALVDEIAGQDYSSEDHLFVLQRDNYFLGRKTLSRDFIVRVYNRNSTGFKNNAVHEKIIVGTGSRKIVLKHSFKHLNITQINQTLTKMIKYTDLGARNKKTCFFIIVITKALFAFIQTYFLRGYFLSGWVGFTIAITNANRRFYKYLKQFLNCKG